MTILQMFGSIFVAIILACTVLGILGVWGYIKGDTAWRCVWTLVVVTIGLGTASGVLHKFFGDPKPPTIEVKP